MTVWTFVRHSFNVAVRAVRSCLLFGSVAAFGFHRRILDVLVLMTDHALAARVAAQAGEDSGFFDADLSDLSTPMLDGSFLCLQLHQDIFALFVRETAL